MHVFTLSSIGITSVSNLMTICLAVLYLLHGKKKLLTAD